MGLSHCTEGVDGNTREKEVDLYDICRPTGNFGSHNGDETRCNNQLISLQPAERACDKHVPACAILYPGQSRVLYSRSYGQEPGTANSKISPREVAIAVAATLAMVGYIVQFIGIRCLP